MKKFYIYLAFTAGALFVLNGLILSCATGLNVANLLTVSIGVALFLEGFFYQTSSDSCLLKIATVFGKMYLLYFILMTGFILINTTTNETDFTEDSVIVLGSSIRGETVGPTLKARLDKAAEYLNKNPKAVAVVSGGQGRNATISEAEAMQRYLLNQGISATRILKEDKSLNTFQNLTYAKEILDKHFAGKEYSIACISSRYHLYRAKKFGKKLGLRLNVYGSGTPAYLLAPAYLRESLSIPYGLFRFRNR